MGWFAIVCLTVAGVLLLAILLAMVLYLVLYFNPMPLVRKMRGGDDAPDANLTYPPEYQAYADRVEVHRDLPYPSTYGSNTFDLYLPKEAERGRLPIILWVHGGSFIAGDKAGIVNLATMLAAEGYAVIGMNYAVAPETKYPAAVMQAQACLAHLPALQLSFPALDAGRVALAGDSAGAQIAAQAALVATDPAYASKMGLQPGTNAAVILAGIFCCGPMDLPALRRAKSIPMKLLIGIWGRAYFGQGKWAKSPAGQLAALPAWVTASFPPTYLTDGNTGSFEVQNRRFGEALRQAGVPVQERYFASEAGTVPHEYQFRLDTAEAMAAYRDIVAFLSGRLSAPHQ